MNKTSQLKNLIVKHKRLLTASMILIQLAVAVLLILNFTGPYLLLHNERSGKLLYCAPVTNGESFSVSYTHSVNKSLVEEIYLIQNSEIYLTSLRYKSFGAGMPTHPEESQFLRFDDGDMVIDGFEREMPRLCYFIGRVADHTLHFRGNAIHLNSLDDPGQPVLFSVDSYPHFLMLFKGTVKNF